ncbi:MAG: hypothetical protein KC731_36635, partial [Myxococcales bacterium]|nr:hypothetical protein [Myxococcales bacterium]
PWQVFAEELPHRDPWRGDVAYRFVSKGRALRHTIPQRLIPDADVEACLQAVGLEVERRLGGFRGEPLDAEAEHLVIVARAAKF